MPGCGFFYLRRAWKHALLDRIFHGRAFAAMISPTLSMTVKTRYYLQTIVDSSIATARYCQTFPQQVTSPTTSAPSLPSYSPTPIWSSGTSFHVRVPHGVDSDPGSLSAFFCTPARVVLHASWAHQAGFKKVFLPADRRPGGNLVYVGEILSIYCQY